VELHAPWVMTVTGCANWPGSATARARADRELGYEPYFLTVHDIVRFARSQGILCQGRGSAANSAVCYCLGITEVDPARMSLLFERFISRERNEPPDIDVDFEHERREEVIQYIYAQVRPRARRAGRHRDQLPPAQRRARRRQGAGLLAGAGRPPLARMPGGTASMRRARLRAGLRSRQPGENAPCLALAAS
jgi:hypothetical protein